MFKDKYFSGYVLIGAYTHFVNLHLWMTWSHTSFNEFTQRAQAAGQAGRVYENIIKTCDTNCVTKGFFSAIMCLELTKFSYLALLNILQKKRKYL